jgi:hypothetical protein
VSESLARRWFKRTQTTCCVAMNGLPCMDTARIFVHGREELPRVNRTSHGLRCNCAFPQPRSPCSPQPLPFHINACTHTYARTQLIRCDRYAPTRSHVCAHSLDRSDEASPWNSDRVVGSVAEQIAPRLNRAAQSSGNDLRSVTTRSAQ